MAIKKYREQMLSVDACQFDGTNRQELITWGEGKISETGGGQLQLEMQPSVLVPINNTDWVYVDAYNLWRVMANADFSIIYAPGPNV